MGDDKNGMNPMVYDVLGSATAGIISRVVTHPLDTVSDGDAGQRFVLGFPLVPKCIYCCRCEHIDRDRPRLGYKPRQILRGVDQPSAAR